MNNSFYFSQSSRRTAFTLSVLVSPSLVCFMRVCLPPCPALALFLLSSFWAWIWQPIPDLLLPPFGIHRFFGQTTQCVCVGRSHRAAATFIIYTKQRKMRGRGGQQETPHDRVSSCFAFCLLGRSGLRACRNHQTSLIYGCCRTGIFFFLLWKLVLNFCTPPSDRERYIPGPFS